jgi:ketosteroid isomerase-like protein
MSQGVVAELDAFMAEYGECANVRDLGRWRELVAEDATYWFTDGSFEGIDAIVAAVQRTYEAIQDEVYTISDVEWVCASGDSAVARYRFRWTGFVAGEKRGGQGRGTNAMVKRDGRWQMVHEHLSA